MTFAISKNRCERPERKPGSLIFIDNAKVNLFVAEAQHFSMVAGGCIDESVELYIITLW